MSALALAPGSAFFYLVKAKIRLAYTSHKTTPTASDAKTSLITRTSTDPNGILISVITTEIFVSHGVDEADGALVRG
jgi:hypothetical protein